MTKEEIVAIVRSTMEEALGREGAKDLVKRMMATPEAPAPDPIKAKTTEERSLLAARVIRALAAGRGDVERAARHAKDNWKDEDVVKALSASVDASGGFLLQEELSASIIELLRPASVVRSLNPVIIPMTTGSILIPKMTGGATATYGGEGDNITATEETFGEVPLVWKELKALVPVSNSLLRFSTYGVDSMVRDDLVAALAQRSDLAFIRDPGTAHTPKGLKYWTPAAQKHNMTSVPDLAKVTVDLHTLLLDLLNSNCRMLRPGWIMAPRTALYLMTIRDGNGNFAFRDEMLTGKLFMFPYKMTTQVPINISSTQSEIYLADFADVVIGEAQQIQLEVSTEASYIDSTGTLVSAFSKNQTVIRAIQMHDMTVRHATSLAMLEQVTWA
jgi:HK97 family phage major capsid protein